MEFSGERPDLDPHCSQHWVSARLARQRRARQAGHHFGQPAEEGPHRLDRMVHEEALLEARCGLKIAEHRLLRRAPVERRCDARSSRGRRRLAADARVAGAHRAQRPRHFRNRNAARPAGRLSLNANPLLAPPRPAPIPSA